MKATEVTIQLTRDQEWELREKYGWRCTREGLVLRAIADAVKTPAVKKAEPKPRKKKEKPADDTCTFRDVDRRQCQRKAGHDGLHDTHAEAQLACLFGECTWEGMAVPGTPCPVCSSELVEVGAAQA